jgi:spermidine synthase
MPLAWMPLILLAAAILWGSGPIKTTAGQIFEAESTYNYIQVLERDGYRYLRLNEGQGIHSVYHPEVLDYQGPWEQFLAAPFFNKPPYHPEDVESMAVIGLAGGTTARQATAVFGPIPIDGFEIDPMIIQVGLDLFGMGLPNLDAIPADGRWGLEQSSRLYSIIVVDAYRPPYIPWHLATREFFQLTRDRMSEDGALVINVGRGPDDRRMIDAMAGTIGAVFPSVYVMDVPGSFNSIIYATNQPTELDNLFANLYSLNEQGNVHPLLIDSLLRAVYFIQPTPQAGIVFTDDRAPVEWITNNIVLSFVFSGGYEEIEVLK